MNKLYKYIDKIPRCHVYLLLSRVGCWLLLRLAYYPFIRRLYKDSAASWRVISQSDAVLVIGSSLSCSSGQYFVVDYRHLPFPPTPGVAVSDQISHEVSNVDSTARASIEDGASGG